MTRKLVLSVSIAIVACGLVGFAADDEPKYTISDVMKQAHKDGLLKKVSTGEGSVEDKARLLELYKAMALHPSPKGSQEEWETRNKAIVEAAQGIIDGKEGSAEALGKAINCKACHSVHRP